MKGNFRFTTGDYPCRAVLAGILKGIRSCQLSATCIFQKYGELKRLCSVCVGQAIALDCLVDRQAASLRLGGTGFPVDKIDLRDFVR